MHLTFRPAAVLAGYLALITGVSCGFVKTNGVQFELDGNPFPFAGTNFYDVGFVDSEYRREVFQAVKKSGYKVLRAWAFNDHEPGFDQNINVYYQAWNERIPSINYGDNGLRLLDDTVRQAEETGIKLILTLSNNWEAYGGMDLWVNNVIGRGAPHDLFYTDARIMQYFKDYVRIIVERYRDSEAIFAWELTNEARCYGPGSNPSSGACKPSTVTSWARNMSDYIKSLDSNHMVSFGSEGFMNRPDTANGEYQYDGSTGGDYDAEIRLPSIDFGTIHLYPGYSPGVDLAWTLEFLAKHDTSSFEAGKPAVLEEYGVSRFENGTFPRAGTYSAWHELILASRAFQGDMTWATLVVRGECPGGNEFAICEDDPDFDQLVTDWTERMNGKAL